MIEERKETYKNKQYTNTEAEFNNMQWRNDGA